MVAYYCETGRVDSAVKKGKTWFIPSHAEKPADKRHLRKKVKSAVDNIVQTLPTTEMEQEDTDAVYHTRDVSRHLGFTRETLRYYEEIGLISPKREKNSQYREFDFYDMSHLMAIDFYRKRGFTPIQIKNLLGTENRQKYEEILGEQMNSLKSEIEHMQGMLWRLEKARNFYDYAVANIGRFDVRTMPAYYVRESIDSIAFFQEYREKVLNCLNLDSEDILSNIVRVITFDEMGYKGSGMYIVMQHPSEKKENYLLEGGRCLYTTLIAENNDNTIMEKMFVLCHQWAKEHQETFFGIGLLGNKLGEKMVQPFADIGNCFAQYGYFESKIFSRFASPEYLPEKQIRRFEKSGKHIQKWFMDVIVKRLDCQEKLNAKPYTWFP